MNDHSKVDSFAMSLTLCVCCKRAETFDKYSIYAYTAGATTDEFPIPVCSDCIEDSRKHRSKQFLRAFQIALSIMALTVLLCFILPEGPWIGVAAISFVISFASLAVIWLMRYQWMKKEALGNFVALKACMNELKADGYTIFWRTAGTSPNLTIASSHHQQKLLERIYSFSVEDDQQQRLLERSYSFSVEEKPVSADRTIPTHCSGCQELLNFKRKMSPSDYSDSNEFGDALTRQPYECRFCHALVCMTCAKHRPCPSCTSSVFDHAIHLLR